MLHHIVFNKTGELGSHLSPGEFFQTTCDQNGLKNKNGMTKLSFRFFFKSFLYLENHDIFSLGAFLTLHNCEFNSLSFF